ncbi:MAG: nitrite/sulfite reductase [Rhodospirillales bacterium]
MYRYDEFDRTFVRQRVEEFRRQVERRLSGELSEEAFKPLRLMNGLYLQLHAYMLRVAIPYGTLSARQMRRLAEIARTYDRGYGHFTTRQNIQFNWPKLGDVPEILESLAEVEMHAIQTSGNCIRNVTSDPYAGVAADEIEDPRVYAEIIRQWSTLHPEFAYLPRKFKIAITGSPHDRAAIKVHDIGLRMLRDDQGAAGFEVVVGGGQGRTPVIGHTLRRFLPAGDLLCYLEAILRTYNLLGRRDNKYKARIKVLVNAIGIEAFARKVEAEWQAIRDDWALDLPQAEIDRIAAYFAPPDYEAADLLDFSLAAAQRQDADFAQWVRCNSVVHRQAGYAIAVISLKPEGGIPGDATAAQMDVVADLAERYSLDEIRVTHEQNLVLPQVRKSDLHAVWLVLKAAGLATPNLGLITDMIACPGLDYCNLANARSIPLAQRIGQRFADRALVEDLGPITLNISGCINACGHHHVANIGLLGVDKKGKEFYQITLGGRADEQAAIGQILGPAVAYDEVVEAVADIVETFRTQRLYGETFLDTLTRIGPTPFKESLYAHH